MVPRQCDWILRAAALAVPRRQRPAWISKWQDQLWFWQVERARAGKSDRTVAATLLIRCWKAFPDAVWQRFNREATLRDTERVLHSPYFVLSVIAAALCLVVYASDGLARTRRAISGPPGLYPDRVVILSEEDEIFPFQYSGITLAAVDKWSRAPKSLERVGYYTVARSWLTHDGARRGKPFAHLLVSPNFFRVLGLPALQVPPDSGSVIISSKFAHAVLGDTPPVGRSVEIDGRYRRIAAVLPPSFWFVLDNVAAISVLDQSVPVKLVIGVGALRPGATTALADRELSSTARPHTTIDVNDLAERLRAPLNRYVLLFGITVLGILAIAVAGIVRSRANTRYWIFFILKTAGGALVITLFAFEQMRAGSLNALGGNRLETDLPAFLVWLFATVLFFGWSIRDQRARCRVCQRILVLPTRIGVPGRVLFEHEGTELVCPKGHGLLLIEPSTETFRQSGQWTKLDESWLDLFATGNPSNREPRA